MGGQSPYAGKAICYPTLVLSLAWAGLWLLWPPGIGRTKRARLQAVPRVSAVRMVGADAMLHRSPVVFVRPMAPGQESLPGTERAVTAGALERSVTEPKYLALPATGVPGAQAGAADAAVPRERPAPGGADLLGGDAPVFAMRAFDGLAVRIDVGAGLSACGYRPPGDLMERLQRLGKPCVAVVSVAAGSDGRMRSVFLDVSSGYREVDALLVRLLWQSTAETAGRGCAGRVTVACGSG